MTRAEENVGTIKFTLAAKRLDLDDVPIRKALGNRVVRELRPPAQASRRAPGERCEVSMRLRCWDGTTRRRVAGGGVETSSTARRARCALGRRADARLEPGASGVGIHLVGLFS